MPATYRLLAALFLALLLSGCATKVETVRTDADTDGPGTMGLDYRDFATAADAAIEDMLTSGAVDHPQGGRYVLVISRVTNDTMQRIDTDQLIKKIRVALLRSGKVVTTTAVGLQGAEDAMVQKARDLRQSKEFNQKTVAKEGQMIAPDYSLSGKILQRNLKLDDGRQQSEYYFQLSLTDITTGLAYWEGETPIVKRGSNKTVTW